MGIHDFYDIEATRLQMFTTCTPRISVSHANDIRLAKPRMGNARICGSRPQTNFFRKNCGGFFFKECSSQHISCIPKSSPCLPSTHSYRQPVRTATGEISPKGPK
jgi:hypothetical protein